MELSELIASIPDGVEVVAEELRKLGYKVTPPDTSGWGPDHPDYDEMGQ